VRLAVDAGVITKSRTVLDSGCGHGGDVDYLCAQGIQCSGWDPVHQPEGIQSESDVVNLGFVVNVIEDSEERSETLKTAWGYARQLLVVAARLTHEADDLELKPFHDGYLTKRGTFQKFYTQHELREWIEETLGIESVAAAPGVYFVFRDQELREHFESSRFRRRVAAPSQRLSDVLFEKHRELLQPLMDFVVERGRLPKNGELADTEICGAFGSIRRAFAVVRRVTGNERWDEIERERADDLLVYLALAHFGKRPRFSGLPSDMQFDVKALFGSYNKACEKADQLLYSAGRTETISEACASAGCGRLSDDSLYVHVSAVPSLPPILRVYEGCARKYVGHVEEANIIKMHRLKPKVSYLSYPNFDNDPHPSLVGALVVPLSNFDVKFWDYHDSPNPPVLHRKEQFVTADYPGRSKFERLSKQEDRWGLLNGDFGFWKREDWKKMLRMHSVKQRGHQLVRESR